MEKIFLSVDFDWFNDQKNPTNSLLDLLKLIPSDIPHSITIEHHEFLPFMKQWVEYGIISLPFDIINIDEHHDYYTCEPPYHPGGTETHCGNWGFRIPLEWYNKMIWVRNSFSEVDGEWGSAEEWLISNNISYTVDTKYYPFVNNEKIIACIFSVSPNYIAEAVYQNIEEMIRLTANHFGSKIVPQSKDKCTSRYPADWKMTQYSRIKQPRDLSYV
ncbi:MAG: hypothetical protein JSW11_00795 [Candidatus Heimdallarchaeota archaeon]|nr:MAG: hypothetical protein JSW11_00795 [Candidatus Heimdallarchaeota archaeon]